MDTHLDIPDLNPGNSQLEAVAENQYAQDHEAQENKEAMRAGKAEHGVDFIQPLIGLDYIWIGHHGHEGHDGSDACSFDHGHDQDQDEQGIELFSFPCCEQVE